MRGKVAWDGRMGTAGSENVGGQMCAPSLLRHDGGCFTKAAASMSEVGAAASVPLGSAVDCGGDPQNQPRDRRRRTKGRRPSFVAFAPLLRLVESRFL